LIFEGDMVKLRNETNMAVEFANAHYYFRFLCASENTPDTTPMRSYYPSELEIIGNIYERRNPRPVASNGGESC